MKSAQTVSEKAGNVSDRPVIRPLVVRYAEANSAVVKFGGLRWGRCLRTEQITNFFQRYPPGVTTQSTRDGRTSLPPEDVSGHSGIINRFCYRSKFNELAHAERISVRVAEAALASSPVDLRVSRSASIAVQGCSFRFLTFGAFRQLANSREPGVDASSCYFCFPHVQF